jgi:hypothetical protein
MVKKLLILGAFCSLSFGGIEDDINKNEQIPNDVQEIIDVINSSKKECEAINYEQIPYQDKQKISLQLLENYYNVASSANQNIEKINTYFKNKVTRLYKSYEPNSFRLVSDKIDKLAGVRFYHNNPIWDTCPKIEDIEEYKKNIQEEYKHIKYAQGREKNEAEIKKLIENEMCQISIFTTTNRFTIEDVDKYIENAHNLYEKLRHMSTPYKIDTDEYVEEAEARYINKLKEYRQRKIEDIERQAKNKQQDKEYAEKAKQNDKAKKALIPKYKNWKNITVPKFQKSLKAGDYVAGGIVWKVDGNLVVIDTGDRGLVSQRREQTYPRVPQDLMPLFMDEITGVARY